MNCSTCKQLTSIDTLICVHVTRWNNHPDCRSLKVCGNCLVGYHIPVHRPSNGRWEFGTVISHRDSGSSENNNDRHQHQRYQLVFMDDSKEWVSVRHDPCETYAQYFDGMLQAIDDSPKTSPGYSLFQQRDGSSFSVNSMDISDQYQSHFQHDSLYPPEDWNVSNV